MQSERVFQITFLVSLCLHAFILAQNPNFSPFDPSKINPKPLEVVYLKENVKQAEIKKISLRRSPFNKDSLASGLKRLSPLKLNDREAIMRKNMEFIRQMPQLSKPAISKPDIISVKKKITLPPVDIEKSSNPYYAGYYQIVREKIRRAAYQNYTRTETGQVYLSFVISKTGELMDMRLINEKSSPDLYLRDIGLRSIRDASPFPGFSKDLDYPQLSFNVIISFEVE